jgi:hypothetical protein
MDVNLCVGVGHDMPLRWSLLQFFRGNYKDLAPTGHALALELSNRTGVETCYGPASGRNDEVILAPFNQGPGSARSFPSSPQPQGRQERLLFPQ